MIVNLIGVKPYLGKILNVTILGKSLLHTNFGKFWHFLGQIPVFRRFYWIPSFVIGTIFDGWMSISVAMLALCMLDLA